MTGSHEVRGSIPLSSTKIFRSVCTSAYGFFLLSRGQLLLQSLQRPCKKNGRASKRFCRFDAILKNVSETVVTTSWVL